VEAVLNIIKGKLINPLKYNHIKIGLRSKVKWYGNKYGGFYLNPDLLSDQSIIYSFGIGEDISFDQSLIENRQCKVYGFDPTPKSIAWCMSQDLPANFHFYPFGISNKTGKEMFHLPKNKDHVSGSLVLQDNVSDKDMVEVEMQSFSDIVKMLKHDRIDVLKMDIEGSEYNIITDILQSSVEIDQIAIELHERFFDDGKDKTIQLVNDMKHNGYDLFAISDSYEEVSFVRRDALKN